MRQIVFILCMIAVTLSLSAQNGRPLFGKGKFEEKEVKKKPHWSERASGDLLQEASKNFLISGGSILAGAGLSVGASFIDNKDTRDIMFISGGVCGVISIITFMQGAIDIGRAGKVKNKEQPLAQIRPARSGLGIHVTF